MKKQMNRKYEQMSNYEKSRWFALLNAIDIIDDACKLRNKKFDTIELKPIDIKKFINSQALKMQNDLDNFDKKKTKKANSTSFKLSNSASVLN